jgi:hypothetical protein
MALDILPHPAAVSARLAPVELRYVPLFCFALLTAACALASFAFACATPYAAFAVVAAAMLPLRPALLVARQSGDRLWFPSLFHRHKYGSLGFCDRSGRPRCNHGFDVGAALVAANRQSLRFGLRLHWRLYRLRTRPFRGHAVLGRRRRLHVGDRRAPRLSEPPMADRVGCGLRSVPDPQPCLPASNGVLSIGDQSR